MAKNVFSSFLRVVMFAILGILAGIVLGLIFGDLIMWILGVFGGKDLPPFELGSFLGMGAGAIVGGIFGGVIGYKDK